LDHSGGNTNNIAGSNIGGCSNGLVASTTYFTSSAINTAVSGNLYLTFWRWLGVSDDLLTKATIEFYDGTTWHPAYSNTAAVCDTTWKYISIQIPNTYKNTNFKVRWGLTIYVNALSFTGWNLDDIEISHTP